MHVIVNELQASEIYIRIKRCVNRLNHLKTVSKMKTDAQIQKDVTDQLKWEPILNASEIGVAVKDGVVTLSGIVDTYSKKLAAETAAKRITGVKAVAEDIQVGSSPIFNRTDSELAAAVVNALKWNSSVPDEKIKVKVEDGSVTLEGIVDWDYQRNAARMAVANLAGVKRVNNFLTLKPTVMASDVKGKISSSFLRHATIDADKISVEVSGNKVTLKGTVRSYAEEDDAIAAAWAAPGVSSVDSRLVIRQEELVF